MYLKGTYSRESLVNLLASSLSTTGTGSRVSVRRCLDPILGLLSTEISHTVTDRGRASSKVHHEQSTSGTEVVGTTVTCRRPEIPVPVKLQEISPF